MATERNIETLIAGNALEIERTKIENIPTGQLLTKAWFTIKVDPEDADNAATTIQVVITTSLTSAGQIVNNATGHVKFKVTQAQSATLVPGRRYHFDIKVLTDQGEAYTAEIGRLVPQRGVTLANA